jgi:hypothetical protein
MIGRGIDLTKCLKVVRYVGDHSRELVDVDRKAARFCADSYEANKKWRDTIESVCSSTGLQDSAAFD